MNAMVSFTSFRYVVFVTAFLATLTGCKPYQSSPAGPCGGFYSEHDVDRKHDLSVTNDGDDLVFRYTNTSKEEGSKPSWAMLGADSMYGLHLHYETAGVTVACLDRSGYPDWRTEQPDDPKWILPAGHSVTKRFSQDRVWKAMRTEAPYAVLEEGTPLRFNYDGFASNLCMVKGNQANRDNREDLAKRYEQRLICTPNTPKQRAKENRQRKSWWDRIFKRDQKEIWHW